MHVILYSCIRIIYERRLGENYNPATIGSGHATKRRMDLAGGCCIRPRSKKKKLSTTVKFGIAGQV